MKTWPLLFQISTTCAAVGPIIYRLRTTNSDKRALDKRQNISLKSKSSEGEFCFSGRWRSYRYPKKYLNRLSNLASRVSNGDVFDCFTLTTIAYINITERSEPKSHWNEWPRRDELNQQPLPHFFFAASEVRTPFLLSRHLIAGETRC